MNTPRESLISQGARVMLLSLSLSGSALVFELDMEIGSSSTISGSIATNLLLSHDPRNRADTLPANASLPAAERRSTSLTELLRTSLTRNNIVHETMDNVQAKSE